MTLSSNVTTLSCFETCFCPFAELGQLKVLLALSGLGQVNLLSATLMGLVSNGLFTLGETGDGSNAFAAP